jgi:hypothetical protein
MRVEAYEIEAEDAEGAIRGALRYCHVRQEGEGWRVALEAGVIDCPNADAP